MSDWIRETAEDIPQKGDENMADCDVFVCKYWEYLSRWEYVSIKQFISFWFLRRAPLEFSLKNMQEFGMKIEYEIVTGILLQFYTYIARK